MAQIKTTPEIDTSQDHVPKTWGEMTDAEKGALLLAQQEGKVIEIGCYIGGPAEFWSAEKNPCWCNPHCYRIRPEPKRETVALAIRKSDEFDTWFEPIGTIDTIDGKPDRASIRMDDLP